MTKLKSASTLRLNERNNLNTDSEIMIVRYLVTFLIGLILIPCARGQDQGIPFILFGDDEILDVTLRFDVTYYMKQKPSEEYLDADLVFRFSESDSLVNHIRLRSRGNVRNELCVMPPIRLNFKECENPPADIEGISNVKMVTHCGVNRNFDEYLLKEYLAYKLYNIVTDSSFRVRLLRVRYEDTGEKEHEMERYGFLIEPVDLIEKRLNSVEKEDIIARSNFIEAHPYDRLCMFQYMIGNDDWHLANQHNLKLIEPEEGSRQVIGAIPYDFDYSGLVDAYYAVPNKLYDLQDVRQRVYMGPCRDDETIRELMQDFLDMKEEFYAEIDRMVYLDKKKLDRVRKYIDSFYGQYKRELLLYNIKTTCIK